MLPPKNNDYLLSQLDSYVDHTVAVPVYEAVSNIYVDVSDGLYTDLSDQVFVLSPYDPMIPETCPVSINDIELYVSKNHSNMNSGFREQFKVYLSNSVLLLSITVKTALE